MHIGDIFGRNRVACSFEFFPPKDQASHAQLQGALRDLMPLRPAYVSVTYGAGGSTRELTRDLVIRLQAETGVPVVAHLTCIGASRQGMRELLDDYAALGIDTIMVLRGDPPRNGGIPPEQPDGFRHAADLVAFVRRFFPHMGIGVAGFPEGHPETPNRMKEMDFLKAKVDAGADYICTQLFFDNRDYYDFRERCRLAGISIPVVAGVMPLTNRAAMTRTAELALGSRFPAPLLKGLARTATDGQFAHVALHWATEQVRDLVENGAEGIHFYTLNRAEATLAIFERLGLADSRILAGSGV